MKNYLSVVLGIVAFAAVGFIHPSASRGETVLIDQDFENASLFKPGGTSAQVDAGATGGKWQGFDGQNFSIVPSDAENEGAALKITRVSPGKLTVATAQTPPADRTLSVRMRVYIGPTNETTAGIVFRNRKENKDVGSIRFEGDNIIAGIAGGKGFFGLRSHPMAWQEVELRFVPGAEQIELLNTYDGKQVKNTIPFDHQLPVDEIVFYTNPTDKPVKDNTVLIGSIHAGYDDVSSLAGRENVLQSAYDTRAFVVEAGGTQRPATRVNDGDISGNSIENFDLASGSLLFELPQPVMVSTIRLFTGNADYAGNASGEVAATAFKVEGLSAASGQWRELIEVKDVPGFTESKAAGNDDFFVVRDFDPLEVSQLRVTILDSNDTQMRATGPTNAGKAVLVREVELYTREIVANRRKQLGNVLQAELELPVYRDQETATMVAILDEAIADGIEVEVTVRERHEGTVPVGARRVTLKPGENRVDFAIADWKTGEYRVQLQASGQDAPVGGSFGRLLRVNRVPAAVFPDSPVEMSGKKMFFPDGWYLESQENVEFKVVPPEVHQVGHKFLKPDRVVQLGSGIGFSSDGKLVVRFNDFNRDWDRKTMETHYAVSDLNDLNKWEIHHGEPADMDSTPNPLQHGAKQSGGSDGIGYSFGDQTNFRFYDKEKDGLIPLNELRVQYVGYTKVDWGVIKPPPQSTWLLWKKGSETLLIQDKPFLQDNISAEEFEQPTNSNDNFAGQWLAEDGKTFYYVRGRLLKRYAPFVARYDNLWQVARILTVFSTKDGIHWDQHYFALPEVSDGPTAQHYGASLYTVPDGNGLMIAYALPYSPLLQHMWVELYYSWDGIEWKRMPGHTPWIPPGKPGDWNFGLTNLHNNVVERDGKVYHLIGWGCEIPHFGGDFLYSSEEAAKLTGDYLEKRYGNRDLANWPFFSSYGSYDKIAEALLGYGNTPGVTVQRADTWWSLSAGEQAGAFTTRPVKASGKLVANAKIGDGGYIDITLVDASGKGIEGFHRRLETGDGIAMELFGTLPDVPFKVQATLVKAELYTLGFQP